MIEDYSVHLIEQMLDADENSAKKTLHPLDVVYKTGQGKGLLTFGRSRLSQFSIFQDVRIFHLMFYGQTGENDRDAWADPLRIEV